MGAGTSVGIRGIGQVALSVADLGRAVAFYRDVMGLTFLFEMPEQGMVFFDCGDGTRLYLAHEATPPFRSHPAVYYRVDSLDASHAALLETEAEVLSAPHQVHATDTIETWMCFAKDPEGNVIALMEERPRL
jgi:predicted enzyme related to lactoylglutathione lyase